jgi:hypothetical protein
MTTLSIEFTTFVGNLDPIGGTDLPGELEDGWEAVIEVECDRCFDLASWPMEADGHTYCPPCDRNRQRHP